MLYGKKRYAEFSQFLAWLVEKLELVKADVLLVPGDVFDTRTPSNYAQQLYYEFLIKVSQSCVQHVVITSGNHDSPSFLDAPKSVLRALNVHIVGLAGDIENELIELKNDDGEVAALIAAVPYLRDKDIRTVEAGESLADKDSKIVAGIRNHYQQLADMAMKRRQELARDVPIIAMGHLFASEGKVGDGVRDLYVGNLGSITADTFDPCFDYVALGHLHISQKVGGEDRIRYSGSPIPMGYGEAGQTKELIVIDYADEAIAITAEEIPCFQELVRIKGDLDELLEQIQTLHATGSRAWVEVNYTGTEVRSDLRNRIYKAAEDTNLEIMQVKSKASYMTLRNHQPATMELLEELTEIDVFERCLDAYEVPEEEQGELISTYKEVLADYHQADHQAE